MIFSQHGDHLFMCIRCLQKEKDKKVNMDVLSNKMLPATLDLQVQCNFFNCISPKAIDENKTKTKAWEI